MMMETTDFNIEALVRPNIKRLVAYASARDEFTEQKENLIYLDANENPFETEVNRYPDPQQTDMKKMLSLMKNIPLENIVLGNGSDEVLDLIFRAFCEPKEDNIILLPPTYGMYEVLANTNDIAVKKIALSETFQPKVTSILDAVDRQTKLLFLCSPNNPTGNSFEVVQVEKILEEFKGIVIIDEAYIDFSTKESWLNKLEQYPNLIVTQTLSKAYGLAGIRLGICYASTAIVRVLNKIKPPYNVNELTQQKAKACLNNLEELSIQIDTIIAERDRLGQLLKEVAFVSKIYPSDANFLLVEVDNANLRYQQLIDQGIIVRNRSNQIGCDNCLRITVGTKTQNNKLVEALKMIESQSLQTAKAN